MSVEPGTYWPTLLQERRLPAAAAADPLACAYLDFARPERVVLGHLGQSLDGYVATLAGHSANMTGAANIRHLHRLRALADAIVVGAGTVLNDDPRLTTRLVDGPSPVRVVLDSRRRLGADYRLFREGPPTLVLCAADAADGGTLGRAEIVPVETADGSVAPAAVLEALGTRGLKRVFVEGGGVTVSRFLFGGCLDILEICVSPLVLGSGRRGLAGPAPERTDEALRLEGCRAIPMGADMLFHQKLRPG